jgi:MFS family permease
VSTLHRPARRAGAWPDAAGGQRLSRNVYVLSAVSFFQDAASELVYPVLPLFLTGALGASPAIVGLIEGVAEATASIMKAVSGRLADRVRRRPLIAAGYGISSCSKLLLGLATAWPLVLVARFWDRVGKGVRTSPRDALIAADTPPPVRGRAFGFHRAADTAGAVVGPLLGLALYEALDHRLRPLLLVAFVPAAVSVALIALVHDSSPSRSNDAPPAVAHARTLPGAFWRAVSFLAAFGLVNFSDAFLILRAKQLGMTFVGIILVYVLYNTTYALLSYPAGRVSDRVPRRLVFAAGLAVFAVAYVGLGVARSSSEVWVLLPLYGAYTALTDGVGKAWLADLLPRERLGTGLGLFQAVTGAASLVAGIWAGLMWGSTGTTPLVASGLVASVIAVTLAAAGGRLGLDVRPGEAADATG